MGDKTVWIWPIYTVGGKNYIEAALNNCATFVRPISTQYTTIEILHFEGI